MRRWLSVFGAAAILAGGLQGLAATQWNTYQNKANGFSMRFPASWEIKEGVAGTAVQAVEPAQQTKAGPVRPSISVAVETVHQSMTLDEYAPRGFKSELGPKPELKVYRVGRRTLSHTNARWWVVSYRSDSTTVKGFLLIVMKGGRAFKIIAVAPVDRYQSSKDLLDSSVASIMIE